jgi:16S rRNA (guanine527-N7)-methyltransferase
LIESDQRKCAFLREAAREIGAPAVVHNARIEDAPAQIADIVDTVTARALAPLPRLVAFAKMWLENGALGVFPQGRAANKFDYSAFGNFDVEFSKSRTNPASHIALIRRRSGAQAGIAAASTAEP